MKKKIAMLALALAASYSANAGLIAEWNFTGFTGTASTRNADTSPGATGTPTLSSTATFAATTSGTFNNGASSPAIDFTPPNGSSVNPTLTFSLTPSANVQQLQVVYSVRTQTSNKGASGNAWTVSVNGGSAVNGTISPAFSQNANWVQYTVSFPVGALAGQSIVLKDVQTGAGNNEFTDYDTFDVNAVPEPTNIALSIFGIGFVSVAAGRKILGKAKR